MRIALVTAHPINLPGGVQEHVKGLYNYLKKNGHYVKIISPNPGKEKSHEDIIYLGYSIPVSSNDSSANMSYCFDQKNIRKLLEKDKFEIIHLHNPALFVGLQMLDMSTSKNIITIHTLPEGSYLFKSFSNFFDILFKDKILKMDGVIAVSKPILNYFPKKLNCRIEVIPNGINTERFNPNVKKIEKFDNKKINILFLGRLDKRKGTIYLIKAFEKIRKEFDNIRLIIVGDGPQMKKCKSYVKKNKILDVNFEGNISNENLPSYYCTADIFCSPATHGESFGIVLLEAMACGKPVVAFANNGYKEVLTGEGAEFLAEPKNVDELAEKLEILIKDKKLRERMGKWGLEEVKKYDWDVVGKEVVEFYEKVLKGK